ncbi:MAG: hypothetical protein HN413_03470 [Chloroflexi bacterium]|jgi:hypothetical protein|nr:hypothetical protein [Chloroflexota bacterium]
METQQTATPPSVFSAMIAGFDAVTNHIGLILFPLGLDLLIWLAPRLRLKNIIEDWMSFVAQTQGDIPDFAVMAGRVEEIWLLLAERFNLLSMLRSYPIGVPSFVSAHPLLAQPFGDAEFVDISSVWIALLIAGGLTVLGLIAGTLFFSLVGQIAIHDELKLLKSLTDWPRASFQVLLLTFFWFLLILGISIPVSCGMLLLALVGNSGLPLAVMIFGGMMLWFAFQFLFVPHSILVNRSSVWGGIRQSIQIIRMTLPTTATFVVGLLLVSQVMDMLWILPPEDSWLMLIGLVGHAFVATGLLSASFIYYQQASHWVQFIFESQSTQNTSVAKSS